MLSYAIKILRMVLFLYGETQTTHKRAVRLFHAYSMGKRLLASPCTKLGLL